MGALEVPMNYDIAMCFSVSVILATISNLRCSTCRALRTPRWTKNCCKCGTKVDGLLIEVKMMVWL